MLPCYEAIWYMIAILSLAGIVFYTLSYQAVDGPTTKTVTNATSTTTYKDPQYPCNATALPLVWILQLLPMLMTQRSMSQEAVVRSIVYSGAVFTAMLVLFTSLFRSLL